MKRAAIISVLLIFVMWPVSTWAQMEGVQEQNSLHGLRGVGFTVNLEQNTAFADSGLVKISAIKKSGRKLLRKNHIRLYSNEQVRKSIRVPVLYLHINMLSTRNGIISFAITANLIQPVKLLLHNRKEVTATTWQDSEVGLASPDNISVIKRAAMGSIRNFINAYKQANSRH
jgi:hypothetical protein